MRNLDVFNCAVVEIFHLCLHNFPVDTDIVTGDLAVKVSVYFEQQDDEDFFYQFLEIEKICTYTLSWLHNEDYIRFNRYSATESRAVLTEKGLNAVNSVPKSIKGEKTFKDIFSGGILKLSQPILTGVVVEFFKLQLGNVS
ncbi:TPA: hypothetical protein ACVU34_004634 [Vibrio parahaemolyticus]